MATPTVDLRQVNVLTEIIVRAGNARQSDARQILQKAYVAADATYPTAIGISTLFRPGATLDELAREGSFRNAKISYSLVGRLIAELSAAGYDLVLYVTPTPALPDHHTLAVAHGRGSQGGQSNQGSQGGQAGQGNQVLLHLPDAAGEALLRALDTMDNPYRSQP